jgi:hypothetical protein
MRPVPDLIAVSVLTALGLWLIFFSRSFQRMAVRLVERSPRWLVWPVRPEWYQGRWYVWVVRFIGLGSIIGAVWIWNWS